MRTECYRQETSVRKSGLPCLMLAIHTESYFAVAPKKKAAEEEEDAITK